MNEARAWVTGWLNTLGVCGNWVAWPVTIPMGAAADQRKQEGSHLVRQKDRDSLDVLMSSDELWIVKKHFFLKSRAVWKDTDQLFHPCFNATDNIQITAICLTHAKHNNWVIALNCSVITYTAGDVETVTCSSVWIKKQMMRMVNSTHCNPNRKQVSHLKESGHIAPAGTCSFQACRCAAGSVTWNHSWCSRKRTARISTDVLAVCFVTTWGRSIWHIGSLNPKFQDCSSVCVWAQIWQGGIEKGDKNVISA